MYLDFEKNVAEVAERLAKLREIGQNEDIDLADAIADLEAKLEAVKKDTYSQLSPWQKVQLSRHPQRPYTLYYLERICERFTELHGDRIMADDHAIVGGFGLMDGKTVMFIGHQKGMDTKSRQYRNFGMANPEGYRKALRLMKLAEKFNKPIITFVDTPGAYPGIEAEQHGQAEAIARNLFEMAKLSVPIIVVIIGEGASGGALGIGVGDRILMMENTWYSVISPESCSSILWRSWDYKEQAAEQLHLTADHMKNFGLVDEVIPEPLGGAHNAPAEAAKILKQHLQKHLATLTEIPTDELINQRIEKFGKMGAYA